MRYHQCLMPFFLVLVFGCQLFLVSCGSRSEIVKEVGFHQNLQIWMSPDLQKVQIRKLAILPFSSPELLTEHVSADLLCSFCGHPVHEHKDFSKAGERLTEYLYEAMMKTASYGLFPLEDVFSRFRLKGEFGAPMKKIPQVLKFGQEIGADTVIVGEVMRIREREGGDYSVIAPASVAFRLKMIRVQDGLELYRITYDETQRPLSEEPERLFRWSKVRFRWLTADQLSRDGMREVAESLLHRN